MFLGVGRVVGWVEFCCGWVVWFGSGWVGLWWGVLMGVGLADLVIFWGEMGV